VYQGTGHGIKYPLGLSPQGLYRKEYLVKISLLLLVEKAIAFLN
jgi:hypothetical protein